MLSRAATVLKGAVRSSHHQPFTKASSSAARPPGGGLHTPISNFHTTAASYASAPASSYRLSPETARHFLARLLTQLELAGPSLRAHQLDLLHFNPSKLSRAIRDATNKLFAHRPVSTHSIAQNISLSSRIALSGNARPRAFGAQYHFPRSSPISGTGAKAFGRGATAVTNVGLGTARNFSSGAGGRPIFQNLVQNVPVAMRALCEADLDLNLRSEVNGMKKPLFGGRLGENVRVARLQKGLQFAAVAPLAKQTQAVAPLSKPSASVQAASKRQRDLERYFPKASPSIESSNPGPDEPFITTLSIPLSPPSRHSISQHSDHHHCRTPLPPDPSLLSYDHDECIDARAYTHNDHPRHGELHALYPRIGSASRDSFLYSGAANPGPDSADDHGGGSGMDLGLDLPMMHTVHTAFTTHAARVTAVFAVLDAAEVWTRGARYEAVSSHEGTNSSLMADVVHGSVRVLRVRFDGWSEETVRALLSPSSVSTPHRYLDALEWCGIESEPRFRVGLAASQLSEADYAFEDSANGDDYDDSYDNPWNISTRTTSARYMAMPEPASMSFIMPTLDFSSTFGDHEYDHPSFGITSPTMHDHELGSMLGPGSDDFDLSPSIALTLPSASRTNSTYHGSVSDDYLSAHEASDEMEEDELNSTSAWSSDDEEPWYPMSSRRALPKRPSFISSSSMGTSSTAFRSSFIDLMT